METQSHISNSEAAIQIGIKLDGTNYALWSQIVEMYISGKDKLGYINGDLPEPPQTDPAFKKWRTENAVVKGWLINSMDLKLVSNFIRFPTAKAVWDSIAITYFDGGDTSQVYDLKRRVTRLKQGGGSIETYYNNLQGLWREVDFRRPNPMKCDADIQKYNLILQEDRVYTFLDGLDDRLDKIRADVLQMQPFPAVEQAYALVRREDLRQSVMMENEDIASGGAMLSRRGHKLQHQLSLQMTSNGKPTTKSQSQEEGCKHCGNMKHTKETCFKLHGYPDWWHELKEKKKRESSGGNNSGRAALVSVEPQLSLITQQESPGDHASQNDSGNQGSSYSCSKPGNRDNWIIDSGATDHMTFDPCDFSKTSQPKRTCIANANGVTYPVTGAGTVDFSPSFSLPNTLLVPSLSNKLLSIGQVTEELNCCAVMYSNFCLFQDILTKEIIGRGTKREGLYYLDDFSYGRANNVHSIGVKERQIWLWHNRLGHPSFRYLSYLFPELFTKIIGSIGAVAAGLDLGKEGPLVHIGSCIASLLGQGGPDNYRIKWRWIRYFNNDRDRRDLITCGASSGVCAAFRAPVGGVLFALEEVATWWRSALLWRTFFSTAVVVVVLRATIELCHKGKCGLFGEGGLIMFDVSNVTVRYNVMDIIPVVIIGVLGGVLGSLYNYLLHKVLRLYNLINQKGKIYKLLLSLSVALFTSVCQYGLPFLAKCSPCDPSLPESVCPTNGRSGNFKQFNCPNGQYNDLATLLLTTNDDAVRNIFSTNTPLEYQPSSIIIFFALYCILGLITFGISVPSGLFLPIILMGSGYGRLLGIIMGPHTNIDQGLFSVLGAASLMAGSMRMTVSLCVIFLELTNNLLLLPITMIVLLIAKTVGDSFNPSIYEIILHLKGLPFMDAKPEPWMRNLTVGELVDVKPAVVSFRGVEKVANIVSALKNTTHNGFPVIDGGVVPPTGVATEATELHGIILRAHLIQVLKKKWFLTERRRTEEWEVREKFTWVELAEREGNIQDVAVTKEEMEMFVDLHPLTNTTPFTVLESMSVAKAMILFRQVGLRHMLVVPKYQGSGVSPVIGILTRQDLLAHNILTVFPHLAKSKRK